MASKSASVQLEKPDYGNQSTLVQVPFPRVHSVVRVRPWTEKEAKTVPDKQKLPRPALETVGRNERGVITTIDVLDPVKFKPRAKGGRFECDTVLWSFVDSTLDQSPGASTNPASPASPPPGQTGKDGQLVVDGKGPVRPAPANPSTQADVYNHAGAPLVDCLMEGFNVGCIVTGASNTETMHTLVGDEYWAGEPRGIIPRFLFDLFERQQKSYREDMDSKIELEAYGVTNDHIHDLLRKTKEKPGEEPLKVREDNEGIHVIGGTRMEVEDVLSVEGPLKTAIAKYNKHFATSNLVISLRLTDIWTFADPSNPDATTKKKRVSLATFVLQVGAHLVFQRCLDAAISRDSGEAPQAKVPTRDSHLTRMIADLFGGNCNVTYVNCVSPYYEHTKDAMTSLGLASKVAAIKCRAAQNTDNSMADLRKLDDEVRNLAAATQKENETIMVVQNELDARTELLREKQQVAAETRAAFNAEEAERDKKEDLARAVSSIRMKHLKKSRDNMETDYAKKTEAMRTEEKSLNEETDSLEKKIEEDKETMEKVEATKIAEIAKTEETKEAIKTHEDFEGDVAEMEDIIKSFDSRQAKIKETHKENLAAKKEEENTHLEEGNKLGITRDDLKKKKGELQPGYDKVVAQKKALEEQQKLLKNQEAEEEKLNKELADLDNEIKNLEEEKKKQGCCVIS